MPNVAQALTNRMNFLVARQGVVAGNIANASTPNYKGKDLVFTQEVNKNMRMARSNGKHLGGRGVVANAKSVESFGEMKNNGNSVVIANEMLKLSEIQMEYTMMTQLYAKQVAMQKTAIGKAQ